jgi:hypothetical protein
MSDQIRLERASVFAGSTGAGGPCRLGQDVGLIVRDDRARLLDLNRGRFYALDPVGTQMLTLALEAGPAAMVGRLAHEYGVAPERVREDWRRLGGELTRKGLLATAPTSPERRKVPGRLTLFWLLAWAWLCVRVFGWAGTVRLWRRGDRPAGPPLPDAEAGRTVEAIGQAIQQAAAVHPLNAQCKERALVGWRFLRRLGLPAELVIGVMLYPFQAHAWVECGPWTVTDAALVCSAYTPAARYR